MDGTVANVSGIEGGSRVVAESCGGMSETLPKFKSELEPYLDGTQIGVLDSGEPADRVRGILLLSNSMSTTAQGQVSFRQLRNFAER